MPSIHSILKTYWGYSSFRPLQEEIINTILKGNDCLALLPTGGGKSICFQVPAITMEGLCLVVTPLIALMKDQVENLRKKGITAFSIHSGMTRKEVLSTLRVAANSNCKFLYVSPERLETNLFKEYLPSLGIKLIAVDEAHCISQWGYDFRPSYLRIASLREELPGVPVLALTASATPAVQAEIREKLLFRTQTVFRQSFERPNLSYSVFEVPSKIGKVLEILTKVKGTAIVYCRSRKKTKEISDMLQMHGIAADHYHAGLTQEERNKKQEAWISDVTRVMVCTNAFGMGIDKPGVRTVIHVDAPDCLENYYQEAGRAGRDGKRSYAVLAVSGKELRELESSTAKKYPGPDEVRKIYKHLMNHLQVPAGIGEGSYYELDIQKFIHDFKLDANIVTSAFKTLEQEEILYFSEQVYFQPKLQVIADRERMFEVERALPHIEPLLKTLLRTYEGITGQPVNINEQNIAFILKKPVEEIIYGINTLTKHGIVTYSPRKEKPQVYLYHNRVKADDLHIDINRYNQRKKQFEERLKTMTNYVFEISACRSVLIGKYFGDDSIKPCGICDNCIAKKRTPLRSSEFEALNQKIMTEIRMDRVTMKELLNKMIGVPKEKVHEVVRFLQAEEKISVSSTGVISELP